VRAINKKSAKDYFADFFIAKNPMRHISMRPWIARLPKDMEDIRTIADKSPKLDVKRIQQWVSEFGEVLGTPELWDTIKPLLGK
jgi:hypothetical protein